MTACRTMVRLSPAVDLRYQSVGAAADRGRPVADIATACEVPAASVRAMLRAADREQGRHTLWCHGRGCASYVRRDTAADALRDALGAGWRHDWRARLLCRHCAP